MDVYRGLVFFLISFHLCGALGIALNSYSSDKRFHHGFLFKEETDIYLKCESSDYPPSSLRMVKKYSKEILDTSVVDGVFVYHIKSVQCSHMGTYVCFYNNDTSQNSTLDVGVAGCTPQLCYEEKKTSTVFAELYDNVRIEFCFISMGLDPLYLNSVFRHDNSEDKLLMNGYESSSSFISSKSTVLSHQKVNITLRHIQENDFGRISIKLCWKYCLIYEKILKKQGMELHIYNSDQLAPVDKLLNRGQFLHLICESGGYRPSSLSIGKLYSKEILHAPVFDGNLVYHFERLQCSDMGTYVCFYKHDPSKNATVNVPVKFCKPQLCHVESRTRTIYASVNDSVIVDICVISLDSPSLTSVFRNGNKTDKLLKSRYEYSSILPMASQGLYWKVNFVLGDLQEEDFGSISVKIGSMIYSIVLGRKEPENDSLTLTIYVVPACVTVVALILVAVAIFLYIQIRPKKSSSRTPAPYYVNEFNDGQPTASRQLLRRSVPRDENEITDRQPASSQQMQGMIQDGRNGYLDVVPGPIYPEPCHIYEIVGQPTASQPLLRHSILGDENELNDRRPSSSQQMQATIQDRGDGYLDVVPGPIYLEPGHEIVGQPTASQQLLRHSVPGDENELNDRRPSSSQEMQATIQDREDSYLEPGPIYESID